MAGPRQRTVPAVPAHRLAGIDGAETHARGEIALIPVEVATAAAEHHLVHEVGDLLMAEEPRVVWSDGPYWEFAVTLGNAVRGWLGRVGSIRVDAVTGDVLLAEDERERILVNAGRLSSSAPS